MKKVLKTTLAIILFVITSCSNDHPNNDFDEIKVDVSTHKLMSYTNIQNTEYLVVFESGLGDDNLIWKQKKIAQKINNYSDVLLYDRASYGKSEPGPNPRNIDKLSDELTYVVNRFSNGRKVILIGHSLGGMIVRDFAIKNPSKVAAILFVDPSHENYNQLTQEEEDNIYSIFNANFGSSFGGTLEAMELIEDSEYTSTLSGLPDVPIIVLTNMQVTSEQSAEDRQLWFNAHEMLGNGISDFTHITTNSGHYIMNEETNLFIENFNLLLSKL